jgi:hypothetical protein
VEVDHPAGESALVQQLELHSDVVGQCLLAAPHHDGMKQEVVVVDQQILKFAPQPKF